MANQDTDLETAMLAAQRQRADQLDSQLREQLVRVQHRDAALAALNAMLAAILVERTRPGAATVGDAEGRIGGQDLASLLAEQELPPPPGRRPLTLAEADALVQQIGARIGGLGQDQQADLARLEALSQKRNEAFELMTDAIRKMQEAQAGIIGNLR